ncbi:hypothetical protein [Floccifex sp.]|uniref:hypothetical protein n=1 Tax=Floccifex sp. TaxID=2815810 RepID=UPI002A761E19|nr:hypothetical protein [Floccifex sp.]MDD7281224.1 hypothetical protein [Erysipelotrichaceae bacterium]MDY2958238.1 hypothetical protein [Floccifex sp.]
METFEINKALAYLKQNYVLYCLEAKTILFIKDSMIVLHHENWHSKINESDFINSFSDSHFQLIEKSKEEFISKEKDDEYYQWRFHHQ